MIEFGQIGGCDRMRVNSLVESYQLPPLQFFKLGARISYTNDKEKGRDAVCPLSKCDQLKRWVRKGIPSSNRAQVTYPC